MQLDPDNKKTTLMGNNAMEINPNSAFPMIHPSKLDRIQDNLQNAASNNIIEEIASDSEFSNLDLDDDAINMLADMALDEEIDDEVSKADQDRGILQSKDN